MHPSSLTGFVHSTEAGSAVDGPGLRYLIFLAGCAFRCVYCHNPDTWQTFPSQLQSVDRVIAQIEPYASWLKKTGGVTITGGEPMFQPDFTQALLHELKRLGLHTALDTQGYFASKLSDAWFDCVDLVLLDIKHIDEDAHRILTGGFSLEPVLATARRLGAMGKELWIRHVIVPGFTDRVDVAERLAQFVGSLPTVTRVELLPYHRLGREKWRALGLPYALEDVLPPDLALVERLRLPFRERGIETC